MWTCKRSNCNANTWYLCSPYESQENNSVKVIFLLLYYACEKLSNGIKFMFIWYDMPYLSNNDAKFCIFMVQKGIPL